MGTGMRLVVATALLAVPAGAGAADPDAVCAVGLMAASVDAGNDPKLPANLRTSLPRWAEFFSGMVVGRYDDSRLGDVLAAAVVELKKAKSRAEAFGHCIPRYEQTRARMRAATQRAEEKLRAPSANPKPQS